MKVVYAYIPVVHAGTLVFLDTYKGTTIWLLDNIRGAEENKYLERDIRALSASQIKLELTAHGFENVQVVDQYALPKLSKEVSELIVPDDEIVLFFTEKYLLHIKVTKVPTFLRWTKQISTVEYEILPDRIVSSEDFDVGIMAQLQTVSEKSSDWWRQIAAGLIRDKTLIAVAHNHHLPTDHALEINGDPRSNLDAGQGAGIYTSIHAEAAVIADAARRGVGTDGCDLYVTTFPCPACARIIVEAGIRRVYYSKGYSVLDAEVILKQFHIEVVLVSGG